MAKKIPTVSRWGQDKARERYQTGGPAGEVKPLPIPFIRDKSGKPIAYDADKLYQRAGIDPATGDPLGKKK